MYSHWPHCMKKCGGEIYILLKVGRHVHHIFYTHGSVCPRLRSKSLMTFYQYCPVWTILNFCCSTASVSQSCALATDSHEIRCFNIDLKYQWCTWQFLHHRSLVFVVHCRIRNGTTINNDKIPHVLVLPFHILIITKTVYDYRNFFKRIYKWMNYMNVALKVLTVLISWHCVFIFAPCNTL